MCKTRIFNVKTKSTEDALISNIILGIDNVKGLDVVFWTSGILKIPFVAILLFVRSSNTHVNAIVSAIKKTVSKELKEKPFHTEGNDNAEWVLMTMLM